MKLLVFGQTGQVARELSRHCPEGWQIRGLGRDAADLADPGACAAAVTAAAAGGGVDAVMNAAAYTAVDRAETEEDLARRINADAPGAMAQACAAIGIPFVHISTDYVFDGSGSRPWRPGDATGPINAYGRSKMAGEEAVRAAGGAHAILRTSWVFSGHGANFVRTMLRLGAERDQLAIVADQVGGPTAAGDIARAVLGIAGALRAGAPGGTHHFAGAPDVSWAGFAREIFRQAAIDCAVTDIASSDYPTPARRPLNSRLDCASLATAYGIARPDWRAALSGVLADLGAA